MKSIWWRIPALVLIVVSASCSGKGESKNEATASAPGSDGAATADLTAAKNGESQARVKDMGSLVDLIVAEAANLPRSEFDAAALTASLGNEPQKIFDWVRDRTWWAPYRGLLRGATGVMLDRVGSNLDRAVLLGDLLRRAGYTVRLAHAQLPEKQARELLGKLRPIPDQRRSPVPSRTVTPERKRAIDAFAPGYEKILQEQIAETKQRSDDARVLIRSQSDQLFAAVKGAAVRQAGNDDDAAIAALQDHWWVEREVNGEWIAMDVLLPDASIGGTLALAMATSEWTAAADAPSIPDSDWHAVQIRVVVERYQGGTTTESTALETVLRPAEVLERPIMLSHLPKPWPEEIAGPKADPNAQKNAALWVNSWVPFLRVGDDYIVQSAFTDSGELTSSSTDSAAGVGAATGGGLDFFGSSLGGGEEAESYATAEWIDYEIRVPGASSQHLRRPVFDLLGPARRSAPAAGFEANTDVLKLQRFEALWSRTRILLQPCEFTAEFVAYLETESIIANQVTFRKFSQERDPSKAAALALSLLERIDTWGPLPDLVLWRSTLGTQSGDWFVDRPNVLNYRVGQSVENSGRATVKELIDVSSNAIGVRRSASRNAFEVRLQQGVTDTVAEMFALGNNLRMAENTASVFALAGSRPARGVLIGSHDEASVKNLGWPQDAAARLAENINSGFIAVALKEPVSVHELEHLGWWRIDPASGATIGVMDTGFHATTAGYAAKVTVLTTALLNFIQRNPIPPFPFGASRSAQLAYQAAYGGLIALHRVAYESLRNAVCAGFVVAGFSC